MKIVNIPIGRLFFRHTLAKKSLAAGHISNFQTAPSSKKGVQHMPFDTESMMQIIWLILLIVFAASEAATVGLTSIWFAAGALTALIAALLGGPLWVQITLFLAVSLLCLAAVRPLAKRLLNSRVEPTNADRVIGAQAQVTEDIDNIHGRGAVVIRGMTWSARSQDGGPISAGTMVKVLRIEGVKVFVEPIAAPVSAGESKTW